MGLNVRSAPSSSASVLGSAAQGVALTVVSYSNSGGGWFQVKGATVTGWISADPTLSAPGKFQFYSSSQFNALYPADWAQAALPGSPPSSTTLSSTSVPAQEQSSVVFRPGVGSGDIVVIASGSVSQLPHGRAGYSRESVTQVVACGITAGLVIFRQTGSAPATSSPTSVPESLTYLAEVRFAVDSQHALGLYADMPDLGLTFQVFKALVASMTFSAPQCSG